MAKKAKKKRVGSHIFWRNGRAYATSATTPTWIKVMPCIGFRRCGVFRCWEQIGSKLLPGYTNFVLTG